MQPIPFHRIWLTGNELVYIENVLTEGKPGGNGAYTQKCQDFFRERYQFRFCLCTSSCTDALEMCALLLDLQAGDEVIIPSYSYVSTANPFLLRGAKVVFADSCADHPNLDAATLEALITPKTKAIVALHYAGMACDMDRIMDIARQHQLVVVEDAAQAVDARYRDRPIGSIGQLAAFSFHESKNITAGEGGLLVVNDPGYVHRAEIIWEKGTNRAAFLHGTVKSYEWQDIGSSFLPSELTTAMLYAQLENIDTIQQKRRALWDRYHEQLQDLEVRNRVERPRIPLHANQNGHIYYLVCSSRAERDALQAFLLEKGVQAFFHYQALHQSPFFREKHDGRPLPNALRYTDCLIRLPLYTGLQMAEQDIVIHAVRAFYDQ